MRPTKHSTYVVVGKLYSVEGSVGERAKSTLVMCNALYPKLEHKQGGPFRELSFCHSRHKIKSHL